jgi:hypothetical protein
LGKVALETAKWIYGLLVAGMLFLFFCLVLDLLSYWIGSGWNPLLGQWPIFSGTVAAIGYSNPVMVVSLLLGAAAIARLVIWDQVPGLLSLLMKHRG